MARINWWREAREFGEFLCTLALVIGWAALVFAAVFAPLLIPMWCAGCIWNGTDTAGPNEKFCLYWMIGWIITGASLFAFLLERSSRPPDSLVSRILDDEKKISRDC